MSEYKKTALVLGAGGFIGSHMVRRLKKEGYWVRGVDIKYPELKIRSFQEGLYRETCHFSRSRKTYSS